MEAIIGLPFDFSSAEDEYGTITYAEEEGPGVFYLGTQRNSGDSIIRSEYIAVLVDASVIPRKALAYGVPVQTTPPILLFEHDDYTDNKGWYVIRYEIHKYLTEHDIPLPEGTSLLEDQVYGMDICPEYFGEFPVPNETPWGPTLNYRYLANGYFWLETAQAGWVLALSCPACDYLMDETLTAAHLLPSDLGDEEENNFEFRFFTYEQSCIPIFEIIESTPHKLAAQINIRALKNVILENYPEYAIRFNIAQRRLNQTCPTDRLFVPAPEEGYNFYSF